MVKTQEARERQQLFDMRKKVESQNFVGLKVQTCRLQITRNRFPTMHKICHFMLTPIVRFFFILPIT